MVLHSIFFELLKYYNALDRDRCLNILMRYGVGPRRICILQAYWAWLQMEAKTGGHYGPIFQSHYGVTQG